MHLEGGRLSVTIKHKEVRLCLHSKFSSNVLERTKCESFLEKAEARRRGA